ncbi:hypothetical protein SK128_023132 [Halocaridina rubra]|uniref:Uncharacterized protein n=1 Tax=Halocaridina rubra TaxID=373956 RepID=A0AAN8X1Q6_HALRR
MAGISGGVTFIPHELAGASKKLTPLVSLLHLRHDYCKLHIFAVAQGGLDLDTIGIVICHCINTASFLAIFSRTESHGLSRTQKVTNSPPPLVIDETI